MSGHYRDGSPLPESLLDTLISTKKAHAGLLCKRQLFLGEPRGRVAPTITALSARFLGASSWN